MQIERIDENERVVETETSKYFVRRLDGGSLWKVALPKGPTPKELSGTYTDPTYAYSAITNYLSSKATKKV